MSPGHMLPDQMSPWRFITILDVPRNLPLEFGYNLVSDTWDIKDIEFHWWWVGGGCKAMFKSNPTVWLRLRWDFSNNETLQKILAVKGDVLEKCGKNQHLLISLKSKFWFIPFPVLWSLIVCLVYSHKIPHLDQTIHRVLILLLQRNEE